MSEVSDRRPALVIGVTPRALSRVAAAAYAGIGPTKFDQLVKEARMPAPARLDGRVLWDRLALDRALDKLFSVTDSADEWSIEDAVA